MARRDMAREAFAGTAGNNGDDFGAETDIVFPIDIITAKKPTNGFDFGADLSSYFGAVAPPAPAAPAASRPSAVGSRPAVAAPTTSAPAAPTVSKLTPVHPALQPPAALKSPLAPAVPAAIRAPSIAAPAAPRLSAPAAPRLSAVGSRLAPAPVSAFAHPLAPAVVRPPTPDLRPMAPMPAAYIRPPTGQVFRPPTHDFRPPITDYRYPQRPEAPRPGGLLSALNPLNWFRNRQPQSQDQSYRRMQYLAQQRALTDSYTPEYQSPLPPAAFAPPPELAAPSVVAPPPPPPPLPSAATSDSHWYEPWTWGSQDSSASPTITQGTTGGAPSEFDDPNFVPPTIKSGSTGRYVSAWQEILSNVPGFNPQIGQGTFDDQTLNFTGQWQNDHGLKADGIVGPQTWTAALTIQRSDDPDDAATYPQQDAAQGDAFGREYGREYYGRERIRPFRRNPQLAFLPLLIPVDSNPDLVSPEDSVGGDTDVVFAQDYGNYGQRHRHHKHSDFQHQQASFVPAPPLAPPSQSAFAPPAPPPPQGSLAQPYIAPPPPQGYP